jgi:dihydroorotate dehydrogenase
VTSPDLDPTEPGPAGDEPVGRSGGGLYGRLLRPALFRLGGGDAEAAHEWMLERLSGRPGTALRPFRRMSTVDNPRTVFGVRFPNPVGLAAGMDKNGRALRAWPALGFGFVEVGTVTWHPQPGNPRPRLFRHPERRAIVNRMGFNNAGAPALAARLAALRGAGVRLPVPLGISIGKSKVTPLAGAVGDYVDSARALRPYADYLAVNVSSPNTPGLRALQDRDQLTELLGALVAEAGGVPVLVKIAPDLADHAIGEVLDVCAAQRVAGLIATNTLLVRDEPGGLSGAPLTRRALDVVTFVAKRSELPVIGVGGIMTGDDARRMFDAGASLVQLFTGFVYGGTALVRAAARAGSR